MSGELQYVILQLANEEYGIPIIQVQEIVRVPGITRVPGLPVFVEGVINLRGRIVPIIDLRRRFGLPESERGEGARIVVTEILKLNVGLIVDGVSEVIRLSSEQIDEIPPSISRIDAEYLSGVGKLEKRIVILLDIEKVLSDIEKAAIDNINKEEAKA